MSACTNHPEFPQPTAPDSALWRYMDSWKFERLLSDSRLVMPAANCFEDHWEGRTPQGHFDWWDQSIAKAATEGQRTTLEHNRGFLGRMSAQFRSHYYVSCWHRNEHENNAMWSCYTETRDAVAIKTRYDALVEALPEYAFVGNVRYVDYSILRKPSMNMFEFIMHKDVYFAFEQETRVVVFPPAANPNHIAHFGENHFASESNRAFRCFAPSMDFARLIQGITVHPDADDGFFGKVRDLCEANRLPEPQRSRRAQNLGR